jgi:hypothetical protein
LLVCLTTLTNAVVAAGQTTAFTYQGQLSAEGELADGSFDLRFALYDTAAGGAQIGTNQTVSAVPVSDGIFTVQLDFGVTAFPGANRFVEIAVRPAGTGSYTTLAPRQQISSSPYAIRTLSAATADALSNACVGCVTNNQIQSVSGGKVMGAIPASSIPGGSPSYIQNTTAPQSGASFNVGGSGRVANLLSAGTVAIGTATPAAGLALDVAGLTRLSPGGSGGLVQIGTPNSETGLSFIGPTNRADLRFNGAILGLVNHVGSGPPGATSGLSLDTDGRVGIGIGAPAIGRLHVVSTQTMPGIYAESGNRAIWGHSTGSSRGVFGDSVSGEGVHGESTSGTGVAGVTQAASVDNPGVFGGAAGAGSVGVRGDGATGVFGRATITHGVGVTGRSVFAGTGVYGTSAEGPGIWGTSGNGLAMFAEGHAKQTLEHGGWVKLMAYINSDSSVIRCYNSQAIGAEVTTPPCGLRISNGGIGIYSVVAPFPISDRFIVVTPSPSGFATTTANLTFAEGLTDRAIVEIVAVDDPNSTAQARFMFIVF